MPYDFKKEEKQFYLPPKKPEIITIPPMQFVAVRGTGDPNEEDGDYKKAMPLLYGIAWTIKMSHKDKSGYRINGFFEHTVPPLEGFWWQEGLQGVDYANKASFQWISLIRLPDFVTKADFDWAIQTATRKKKLDFSPVELLTYEEGLCVQCMHIGAYDDEPATIALMDRYARENGYEIDITSQRFHHEIYLSDPRKANVAKMKTVLRHPIK